MPRKAKLTGAWLWNAPAFLAVLLFVFGNASHIHLRYCLDGAEFPVSIHFESTDSHQHATAHDAQGTKAADVESELSLDTLLSKLSQNLTSSVAVTVDDFHTVTLSAFQIIPSPDEPLPSEQPPAFLPPPRAPPAAA